MTGQSRSASFIVRAKALGFTLQEIGDLLDLRATPGAGCADVQARAEAKIADIAADIRGQRTAVDPLHHRPAHRRIASFAHLGVARVRKANSQPHRPRHQPEKTRLHRL